MTERYPLSAQPFYEPTPGEDAAWMALALETARSAAEADDIPVGAVAVRNGEVLAVACNMRERTRCATHHAEILAIEEACRKLGGWRLPGTTLYVTLEPCPMCAGAIINARIPRVVYGASDPKAGAFGTLLNLNDFPLNHKPALIRGVRERECADLLRAYFRKKRLK